MKLTTRGRYALQALLDMVEHSTGKATKLEDISKRQSLPIAYLEQLFRQLRLAEVVKSVRGPGGGYVFSKNPADISIGEVLRAVKELTSYSEVVKLSAEPTRQELCAHKAITRLDEASSSVLRQSIMSLV